jgi:hypothetical protein
MAASTTLQVANPAMGTVSRLPQTSGTPADKTQAPFVRLSRKATVIQFDSTSNAFGGTVIPVMKAVGGYIRRLRLEVITSGGSITNTGAWSSDQGYAIFSLLLIKDPFNTPIINVDGYGLYLIDLFSAQIGAAGFTDISKYPSFSANVTTTGIFTIPFYVPFELDSSGYCALPALSAAATLQLQINLNSAANTYNTGTTWTTQPVIEVKCFSDFWAAPVDAPNLAPPGVGSSAQWSYGRVASAWSSATNSRLPLPRVGTYIHTLILALRDSGASNNRIAGWPLNDLTFYVDNVPIESETLGSRNDKLYTAFGFSPPTGVIAYTFRDSVGQMPDMSDTHDLLLYTTPATSLEIAGSTQSTGTGPFRVDVYTGELYPVGPSVPYTHLAQ